MELQKPAVVGRGAPIFSGGLCALGTGGTSSSVRFAWVGSLGVPSACGLHACLPGFGEWQGEVRLGEAGCTGARPGCGLCKVWLGRMEEKEEEKSDLLTSKSCTTGTGREGGHAATKHRETEITITEATATGPAQPQCQHLQRGPGSNVWRAMPARDFGAGAEAKPGALWGLEQQHGLQDDHALRGSHVLTGV